MALYSLRLRRALSLSSSLLHQQQFHFAKTLSPLPSVSPSLSSAPNTQNPGFSSNSEFQSFRSFRSSAISLSYRNQRSGPVDEQEIGPDTILFEGCDYNHWLITMDLPKDYTSEQMVEAYVRAATQVFGSEEEAKKRIYACSTTVYVGFQVECSEETSEKFKEVEGVVFVLPDSYIDPINKEYGGDKYVNGTIIPRPPPIQYGRREGRSTERRPRAQPRQNRGPMHGESRNFGPPQSPPPHQNYGPPGSPQPQQNYGESSNFGSPQNPPPYQNYGPPGGPLPQQNYGVPPNPPPQQNYGLQQNPPPGQNYGQPQYSPPGNYYGQAQNLPPQQSYGHQLSFTNQQNYGPQGTRQNYGPAGGVAHNDPANAPGGWNHYQGARRDFQQGDQRGYTSDVRSFAGQDQSYTSPQDASFNQGLSGARQEMNPGYGQSFSGNAQDQRFLQGEYGKSTQGVEQRHYTGMGIADQQRY